MREQVSSTIPEKRIEKKAVDTAKILGMLAIKMASGGGYPDRLFITPEGCVYWIEFKSKTGRLSKLQALTISKLRKLKQTVFVVKDIFSAERMVKYIAIHSKGVSTRCNEENGQAKQPRVISRSRVG